MTRRARTRRGFTLLELMVAAAVTAVLMSGVLLVLGGMGRDRRRLAADDAAPRHGPLLDLLRRDLANAETIAAPPGGRTVVLVGHGGIDQATLAPTGRLTRVIYDVRGGRNGTFLVRQQEYLDDTARPERWTELVGQNVASLTVAPAAADGGLESQGPAIRLPSRVRVHVGFASGAIEEELRLR